MIKLYLFGGFRAEDQKANIRSFATNKARALLVYLAVAPGEWHDRQRLANLLWPTSLEAVALRNLRTTLARVRVSLENPSWLVVTRQGIQLVAEPHQLWTDITAFDYLWDHLHNTNTIHTLQEYLGPLPNDEWDRYRSNWMTEAVTLYQGEFLAGLFLNDDGDSDFWQWRRQKQEEYHTKVLSLLDQLADHAVAVHAYAAATDYARRQLAMEPWSEQAHRQLMLGLVGVGDTSGALAHYAICRQTVLDEFGVEPEAETTVLYQRIYAKR